MNAEYAWKVALKQLEGEMSCSSFDRWVRNTYVVFYYDGLFWIGTFDDLARDWLEDHLASAVRQALTNIMKRPVRVQFIVEEGQWQIEAVQPDPPGQEGPITDLTHSRPSEWQGLTPLSDELVEKYGMFVAAVGGKIWCYSQIGDWNCRATVSRLAQELKLSHKTIIRSIQLLIANGYVVDLTPTLRHRPHLYFATDRMVLSNLL